MLYSEIHFVFLLVRVSDEIGKEVDIVEEGLILISTPTAAADSHYQLLDWTAGGGWCLSIQDIWVSAKLTPFQMLHRTHRYHWGIGNTRGVQLYFGLASIIYLNVTVIFLGLKLLHKQVL